jgi:hypothetical protein
MHDEPRLMCVVQTSPNTFMLIAKLGLEGNIPSLFNGDGIDCCISSGFKAKSHICSFVDF